MLSLNISDDILPKKKRLSFWTCLPLGVFTNTISQEVNLFLSLYVRGESSDSDGAVTGS
jgi:hypothetical protein